MNSLIEELTRRAPVLLDGAWGTELQARGLAPGDPPEGWNLDRPELVSEVARAYVEAGSEVILTNTFGGNRYRLAASGLEARVGDVNRAGIQLSLASAAGRARVFASMGPTGKILIEGDVSEADLESAFLEQASALAEAGAQAIVIETMSDLAEAKAALAAVRRVGLPAAVCMTFDSGRERDRTMMGHTPETVGETLAAAGADVVGANCGQGIEGMASICRRLQAASQRPVWIKANAGLPEVVDGRAVYRTSADDFANRATDLVAAGAAFIGGCCGTDPSFIRALRERLASL